MAKCSECGGDGAIMYTIHRLGESRQKILDKKCADKRLHAFPTIRIGSNRLTKKN